MMFKDDEAVVSMLFRNVDTMKTFHQTFSSFCQWCGSEKEVVKTENPEYRVLMCSTCDRGDH